MVSLKKRYLITWVPKDAFSKNLFFNKILINTNFGSMLPNLIVNKEKIKSNFYNFKLGKEFPGNSWNLRKLLNAYKINPCNFLKIIKCDSYVYLHRGAIILKSLSADLGHLKN